jgi:hypothetical protein
MTSGRADKELRPSDNGKDAADRQREKIAQIGRALLDAGLIRVGEQAKALGLLRSTTWNLLRADHKRYGLSPN